MISVIFNTPLDLLIQDCPYKNSVLYNTKKHTSVQHQVSSGDVSLCSTFSASN